MSAPVAIIIASGPRGPAGSAGANGSPGAQGAQGPPGTGLAPAAAVSTTNISSLSGLATVDGYTLAAGDIVLLAGQTTSSQNGPHVAATGAWTRPSTFASAAVVKAQTIAIIQGTVHAGETWLLQTNGTVTVDTTAQTWVRQLPSSVVSVVSAFDDGTIVQTTDPRLNNRRAITGLAVGDNNNVGGFPASNGTDTDGNFLTRMWAERDVAGLRLRYINFQGIGTDTPSANPVTVSAGVGLTSTGTPFTPVYFQGVRTATIPPSGYVDSDIIPIYIPGGTYFWVRSRPGVTSGGVWYGMAITDNTLGEGGASGIGTTDDTLTGTITPSFTYAFAPLQAIAQAETSAPYLVSYGDSIGAGVGDQAFLLLSGGGVNTEEGGFLKRACWHANPFLNCSVAGETVANLSNITTPSLSVTLRRMFANFGTTVYSDIAINDCIAGTTAAVIEQDMVTFWSSASASGARVIQSTLTPHSSTTDGWMSPGNQTPFTNDTIRTAVNTWLRGGAPIINGAPVAVGTGGALLTGQAGHPLFWLDDLALTVESAMNSGLWKTFSTTGNWINGSKAITNLPNGHPLTVGMFVYGTGFQSSAPTTAQAENYVTAITANGATLLNPVSATETAATITGNATFDGLHPSSDGHVRMENGIDKTKWA